MNDNGHALENFGATVNARRDTEETVCADGEYMIRCVGPDGRLKWSEVISNLVTTVGKNLILDASLGNTAIGAVFMGLKAQGTPVAGDTMAGHAGWNEVGSASSPTFSGGRPSPAFSAASGGSKSCTTVTFSMTSAGTVAGCFINVAGSSAVDNTTGTLLSAGDFAAAKVVASGDTLNVTYTLSV